MLACILRIHSFLLIYCSRKSCVESKPLEFRNTFLCLSIFLSCAYFTTKQFFLLDLFVVFVPFRLTLLTLSIQSYRYVPKWKKKACCIYGQHQLLVDAIAHNDRCPGISCNSFLLHWFTLLVGLDPFVFFLIFKFKFIDFKKTKFKFKFIDFKKTKFKFKFWKI